VLFVGVTLAITWWAAKRTHSRDDFYAAGSSLGGVQNGFAIAGDFMSAASFLGVIGLFFMTGYDALYFQLGLTVGWVIVLLVIAERLRNLGRYTFADALSVRFQRGPIRTFAACGTIVVAVPYLLAQMVAAGTLVESLFGLSYAQGVIIVGVLMTLYVSFGGMIATTWVQIVKAGLLLFGGTALCVMVLAHFDFDLGRLATEAVANHPRGVGVMHPGVFFPDMIAVLSLCLAFIGGPAGLPHVLMRFFTVPNAREARRSAGVAMVLVTYFNWIVLIIGLGAMVLLIDHPKFSAGGLKLIGGGNMAAIHLSELLGGDLFLGFISAVAFATILAVVSGITLSAAATVSHDLYANVFRYGRSTEREEIWVSRITTITMGAIGIGLGMLFQNQNVAVLATIPMAIAASANFPVLIMGMYWRGLTTRGAIAGGSAGLAVALILIGLGPNVWVGALGFDKPIFPYAYPTLFSMPTAFLVGWLVSKLDKSARAAADAQAFDAAMVQARFGHQQETT
jgi:cation/acetate symporter